MGAMLDKKDGAAISILRITAPDFVACYLS